MAREFRPGVIRKAGPEEHPTQCITPGRPGMVREAGPEDVRSTDLGNRVRGEP